MALSLFSVHESDRNDIDRETEIVSKVFCYPRGSQALEVRKRVEAAGFEGACTVSPGANAPGVDLFGLRRTEISGEDTLDEFRLKLDGAFDGWHRLVQRIPSWRRK